MSAVDLLGQVICYGRKVCVAELGHDRDVRALLSCGLLLEAGVVSSVVCMDCENSHAAEVIFDDGAYGYFCPDLGIVNLERRDIAAVEPDLPALIKKIAETFACARRKTTPVYGNTWRIGSVKTDHGDITLYFHPRLRDAEDALDLAATLSREISSAWRVVVTACGQLPVSGAETLALGELVVLSPTGNSLDPAVDLHAIVGVPASAKTGAPNRFGEMCMTLIETRIKTGQAKTGRNDEAKAVHALLKADLGADAPSLATVRTYVTKARPG